jgi:para-nitrobenzyl esterase
MSTQLRVVRRLVIGMVAAYAALAGAAAYATSEHPVIAFTDKGFVKGVETPTMKKFLGIPYAAPPVGALRWRAPQSAKFWFGVRDATQFANHCPQPPSPFGLPSTTEDCLYLNVYAPNHKGILRDLFVKHPVMVWIHGGALFLGESDDYDPTKLVTRENVVVVTINYRLGLLGFLAHPALSAETSYNGSGDYGWMDQQAALKWVQRNIRFFGGDPDNVTIFGESAGGLSVHAQLASPGAAGMFDRAIIESGAYFLNTTPLATAEGRGTGIANAVGCSDQTVACLRAVPVEALLAAQGSGGFTGNVDGKVLTQPILAALASGQFNQVPVMQGTNHDEWRLFVALNQEFVTGPLTEAQYPGAIASTLGVSLGTAAFLAAQYPVSNYPSPSIALGALGTDAIFACNGRLSTRLMAQHVSTYAYEFNDQDAPQLFLPPVSFDYGAYHASEIQYILGVRPVVPAPALTADQTQLSDDMVSYWGRFARKANPNSAHTPNWAQYDPAADVVQSLLPPTSGPKADFAADHKCAVWTPGV